MRSDCLSVHATGVGAQIENQLCEGLNLGPYFDNTRHDLEQVARHQHVFVGGEIPLRHHRLFRRHGFRENCAPQMGHGIRNPPIQ